MLGDLKNVPQLKQKMRLKRIKNAKYQSLPMFSRIKHKFSVQNILGKFQKKCLKNLLTNLP